MLLNIKNNTFFILMTSILSVVAFNPLVCAQDAAKGSELYKTCVQCHGADGLGDVEQKGPRIAGQFDWYIVTQLNAFKKKERINEKMYPFISQLSEKDFLDIAAHVSKMPISKGK
jgi:cytochrome c553